MIDPWIADLSYGHNAVTGAQLAAGGCVGAIAYAGCDDPGKNATRANVDDWLSHNLWLSLVIENGAADLLTGGAPEGARQARNVLAGAAALGLDPAMFAIFTAADWDTSNGQLGAADAGFEAFAREVPVPGLYGNSWLIDYCKAQHHMRAGWQSNSSSFSYGPSPAANLLQRYNDPRAAGLPVDASDIQITPVGMLGETLMQVDLTPAALAAVANAAATAAHASLWNIATDPNHVFWHQLDNKLNLILAGNGAAPGTAPTAEQVAAAVRAAFTADPLK